MGLWRFKVSVPALEPVDSLLGITGVVFLDSRDRRDAILDVLESKVRAENFSLWRSLDWIAATTEGEPAHSGLGHATEVGYKRKRRS